MRRHLGDPPASPLEVFYFTDNNCPGAVYIGTQAHMDGMDRQGGYASKMSPAAVARIKHGRYDAGQKWAEEFPEERYWYVEIAPNFWLYE